MNAGLTAIRLSLLESAFTMAFDAGSRSAKAGLRRLLIGGVCLGLLVSAAAAETILAVRVVDEAGRAIESAAVILRPELDRPVELPPPFFTDAAGRVVVEGLAAGNWQVEVRSAGYMIFSAYVKLIDGLPPVVGFTAKQRTGTFWAPLDVSFSGSLISPDVLAASGKSLEKRERKQLKKIQQRTKEAERRASKQARAESQRSQRSSRGADVATLAEPTVRTASTPSSSLGQETVLLADASGLADVPGPADVPGVADADADASADAEAEADAAEPVPTPEPAASDPPPRVEPRPSEAVPPTRVPTIDARPVLLHGGSCPECKTGEWALVVERRASPRTGSLSDCGAQRAANVRALVDEVLTPAGQALAGFAGPLLDSYGSGLPAELAAAAEVDSFRSLTETEGACQDLVAILPSGARFVGFRFEAREGASAGDCFGVSPCSIGEARFTTNPEIVRLATSTIVHTSFANESTTRTRYARLVVLFRPAAGWTPP